LVQRLNEGRELTDYLLLPLRIYMGGSSEYSWAIPPLLFALVPAYALVKKHRLVSMLLAFSALHFVIWSQGLHATRYLFPIFPALSLVVAYVLSRAAGAARLNQVRALVPWLVLISMVPSASMATLLLSGERPFGQLVGLESRSAYLSRVIPDYVGIRYLNDHRSEVEKVYVIGDPRLFYLAPPAVIDPSMGGWASLAQTHESSEIGAQLRQAGISHILLSPGALARAMSSDPGGAAQERLELFYRTSSVYLMEEFSSEYASVYRLVDAGNTGTSSSESLR
jgi:hypothetical protein